jgi:tetratricopeptide (TPR) repeat protein
MDDVKALAASAQENFKQQNIQPALTAFRTLRQLRPENSSWADRYAQCEMLLKRWPEAQAAWAETIAQHGASVGRVNSLARCLIETRDYAAARDALVSAQAQIEPNAHFFVISSFAALAAGDRASALSIAAQIETSAGDRCEDLVGYLCALLRRLVGESRGEDVLWMVDALLPEFQTRGKLLQLGIFAAASLALFERKLSYTKKIRDLNPASLADDINYLSALIDAQRLNDAIGHLNTIDAEYPKAGRSAGDDKSIEALGQTLLARPKWQAVLRIAPEPETFFAVSLKLSALLTLKDYPQACSVAEQALRDHAEHPWFMNLLAKANEKLGRTDLAEEWLAKAVRHDPGRIAFRLDLADLQIKTGKLAEAGQTVAPLAASHPGLPAVSALMTRLGQAAPSLEKTTPPATRQTWLHGGDSGDIIYALSAMQGGGGGALYLTPLAGTREPMTTEKIAFLAPLLRVQTYVDHVAAWQGEPISRDFNLFRRPSVPDGDLATQHWRSVLENTEPDIRTPWLTLPTPPKHGRPVFARSPRYRNPAWDALWRELKHACPDAIFVGTAEEFRDFGHGEHVLANNALELAHIIHGASVFVGNQSLPYAIAEGLKIGRMLEVYGPLPNCTFPGALALPFGPAASQA